MTPLPLADALRCLADNPAILPIAGCTDAMVADLEHLAATSDVIDLLRVPEIHGVRERDGAIEIGATTTFSEIRRSALVRRHLPALVDVAAVVGGWQIQNRATIGGNVANASPAGDSLPVLLALDARVMAASASGIREIPYDEFHTGYRLTALRPGELIGWIRVPTPDAAVVQAFRKVGTREAQAISKLVVSMRARLDGGIVTDVRFAAGSVAPTPIRLRAAEAAATGRPPDRAMAEQAGRAAAAECAPIDDVRSTAEYRRWALGRVVRRMVLSLASL
jgi:CO/xanthine dehydrogenase FAD-binding subunit